LVVSSMVGSVVWVCAGYMVSFGRLSPMAVLGAWTLGGLLAMCGALAYSEAVKALPGNGGEYHLLSRQWHPALGFAAGWSSLLFGFAAPAAMDAVMAVEYLRTAGVSPPFDDRWMATGLIVLMVLLHGLRLSASRRANHLLFATKALLVVVWLVVGALYGGTQLPDAGRAGLGFDADAFTGNLFYVMLGYSGWNAAIYAAGEFRRPARDVPRSMLLGCLLSGLLYLAINFVFLANVPPGEMGAGISSKTWTLAHLVMSRLAGESAARLVSAGMVFVFLGTLGALFYIGPRVSAAMASDGLMPRWLGFRRNGPPLVAVLVQAAVALVLVWSLSAKELIESISQVLVLYSGLVCLGVWRMRLQQGVAIAARGLVGAAVFFGVVLFMFVSHPPPLWGLLASLGVPLAIYVVLPRRGEPSVSLSPP